MFELLQHELYKIYSRKIIYITLLFFVLIIVYFTQRDIAVFRAFYGDPKDFYNLCKQYEGPLTQYKLNAAKEWFNSERDNKKYWKTDKISDGEKMHMTNIQGKRRDNLFGQIQMNNGNVVERTKKLGSLKHKLTTMENKQSYSYRVNLLQYNMLNNLKNLQPPGTYKALWIGLGPNTLLDYLVLIGVVFMCAMLLLGLSPMFTYECSTNMDSIILSTKKGRGPVITAKILASCVYIISIGLFFPLLQYIVQVTVAGRYSMVGWNNPIQASYEYTASLYNYTFSQYFFVHLCTYLFGSIALGMIVLLISALSRSVVYPLFIGGCIFVIPVFFANILHVNSGFIGFIVNLSYTELMKVRGLFGQFTVYDIFGYPVLYANVMFTLYTLLTIAAIALIYKVFREHQVY